MKVKYCFTLAVILIILLSLTTVAAGDNMTDATLLDSDAGENLKECESQSVLNDPPSLSEGDVDLSVVISVENIYRDDKFNRAGYTVPWTITPKVAGATAHNVRVCANLSNNMEIVSNTPSIGVFNPTTGIWDIGDLSSSDNASLLILTKLKADGRFNLTVNAQTTSKDINLSNNDAFLKIKSGTGKKPSNTTKTSDQSGGLDDYDSPGSDPYSSFVVIEEQDEEPTPPTGGSGGQSSSDTQPNSPSGENNGQSSSNQQSGSQSGNGNSGSSSNNGGSSVSNGKNQQSTSGVKSVAKSTNSISQVVAETFEAFDIFNLNSGDSNSKGNLSPSVVKAIVAQNYTRIPFMIFAAFLILLVSFVGYDKIKS